jgi:hypothetical protein
MCRTQPPFGVLHLAQVRALGVVHRGDDRVLFLALGGDGACAAGLQGFDEGVAAFVMLRIEIGEIGGEAFAQPDVAPAGFGDAVAEPLVGDLVGHDAVGGEGDGLARLVAARRLVMGGLPSRWPPSP